MIFFAQSSHVDPDWLLTSDQYQRLLTDKTFDRALVELGKDPRYIYSVECTFFFKRYWDSHPQNQDLLRKYVNEGRIRFSGTGITSPDTLIPEGENLVRDYVAGYYWLKKNGMNPDPKVAYYPDSFGHSPAVPSILNALGYKYAAFTRIDGMYFIETDRRSQKSFPTPGSSAELLQKKLHTLDFVWQGPDQSEVITHWNLFTYFQGDMIDYSGAAATYGIHLGIPARSAMRTNAKIDSYIKQLRPLSPTGYMFCPIGGDFNSPVKNLPAIIENYNKTRYPKTGVYAVFATLEDYMKLVETHKDQLPVVALDPNPLFMGFYSSRPELKQRARKLSRDLVLAEELGVLAQERDPSQKYPDLSEPWAASLFSDHHDFITGTAPDRTFKKEQIPVLKKAQGQVDQALESLTSGLPYSPKPNPAPIQWQQTGSIWKIENDFYRIEMDSAKGGCITSWYDKKIGKEILAGPSNDVVSYYDAGGLWRMGNEFITGKFEEKTRVSRSGAEVGAQEKNGILFLSVSSKVDGMPVLRTLSFRSDEPLVRMKIKGTAKRRRAFTISFQTRVNPGRFVQEIPYGVVERPVQKIFNPTFWAVKNWVDLEDASKSFGVNLALTAPASVHASQNGILEMIVLRYAPQERVMGVPLLAFPAIGSDPAEHEIEYAFWPHGSGSWLERKAFATAKNSLSGSWADPAKPDLQELAGSVVQTDRDDVVITAIKKAESGEGVIVRLFKYADGPVSVKLNFKGKPVKQAFLADGLERPQGPLVLKDGKVQVEMTYALATILLTF